MSLNIQLEDGYKQVAGNGGSTSGSILYYDTKTRFPSVGEAEKLYVDKSTGEIFTWNSGLTKYVPSGITTAEGIIYDNNSSGLTAEIVQDAIDETVAKINDIQLFKFPNATIIGAPTINNGQVSGFSALNYMKFPFIVNMQGRPFTIDIAFTTGTDITNQQNIIDGIDHGIAFAIRSSKFIIVLGSKTGEWDISSGEKVSSVTVQPQTTYRVRISWDGSVYKFEYSTNGESYTEDTTMRITSSLSLYPTQINIGVTSGLGGIFTGIINMNYCSLTISNKVIWTGMDDVGLATRMAVDMSNIDEAGVEKVKSIIGDLPTKESLELDNVTNDKQVKGLSTGTTNGHLVTWGADGYTVDDSGAAIISTDINIEANKDNVPTAGAVKTAIETATTGMQKCLGTVDALTGLSTTAKTGEYYRVKIAWNTEDVDVHICDVLIAEKDNPEQKIDGVNWSLLHNEMDTNTTYTLTQDEVDGHKLTFESSDGNSETIIIPDNNTEYTAKADDAIQLSGTEFSHKTGNGYNHIPTAGAAGNVLRNNGSGSVAWETVDDTPTEGSDKLITSGGVKTELDKKANKTFIESVDNETSIVTIPENVLGFAAVSKISGKTVKIVQKTNYLINQVQNYTLGANTARMAAGFTYKQGHVYMMSAICNVSDIRFQTDGKYGIAKIDSSKNKRVLKKFTCTHADFLEQPYIYNTTSTSVSVTGNYLIFDLTEMGIPNITEAEFEIMFPNNYYERTDGSLYHTPVESVVSYGKNLFNINGEVNINYNGLVSDNSNIVSDGVLTCGKNASSEQLTGQLIPTIPGNTYTITVKNISNGSGSGAYIKVYAHIGYTDHIVTQTVLINTTVSFSFTAVENDTLIGFGTLSGTGAKLTQIQVEHGGIATEYIKHTNKTTVPIPQEILDLPDYGCSAIRPDGTVVSNEVDFENGMYHHRVASVDMGSLIWRYDTSQTYKIFFVSTTDFSECKRDGGGVASLTSELNTVLFDNVKTTDKTIIIGNSSVSNTRNILARHDTYTSDESFRLAMKGKSLLYEINEELIDISSILYPFKVESGGTITFENEHNLNASNTILYKKEVL